LGPALAASEWHDFWVYLLGPFAGASVGALAYQLVRGDPAGALDVSSDGVR
jgi:glycerol uptake facilitator-like aquaporin